MNFINSLREGNKKNIIDLTIRLGFFTLLQFEWNPGVKFRFIILNLGIEI